ncbi:MAG TPA: 2-dehydropantoate 2-reductase [Burkholderiales bacterium]|nr:2-dehydropantoate 2-reductase [Burkholderiales bacterium]
MKILVMGAGGVGGYFGARLAQAGNDVVFIARGKHLEAIQANGLKVKSGLGDLSLKAQAMQDPARAGVVDVVLFCVKLWDTEAAAEQLKPVVGPETIVIPFQNGVESIERLRKILPERCVMGGSAYIGTRIASPGVIEHTGTMARIRFGALLPAQRQAAERFLAACRDAGFGAELAEDIVSVNWEKFVFLVALSSATAVARAALGTVRSDPDLRWLFEQAMRETFRLALAKGAKLPPDFVEKQLAFADSLPPEMRASLLHDLQAGGRLEAPWLCGAVARMSREAGLDAPVNHAVYAALKPYVGGSQVEAR